MRIIEYDRKAGKVKLKVDSENDLWTLYSIIVPGDRVYGVGYRRMEAARDKIRAEKVEKKRMYLGIRVEKVEYHEFSNYLRVLGVIIEGPQDLGQHHTMNIDVGTELTIVKDRWGRLQMDMLKRAERNTNNPNILILSVEDDNITLAVLYPYGLKEVSTVEAKGLKGEGGGGRQDMFAEAAEKAASMVSEDTPVLIVGPGFIKEDFRKYAVERTPYGSIFSRAVLENTGSGGMNGAREAIARGAVSRVVRDFQAEREEKLMEELFAEISRNRGRAAYGEEATIKALNMGAAEKVLLTNEYLKGKLSENPGFIKELEDLCLAGNVDMEVLSSLSSAGERLDSLGGVAALLRFQVPGI